MGHPRERRWSEHFELRDLACTLIPSGKHEAGVIATVVIVQMAEKEMRDRGGADAELQQSVMRSEAVIEHDAIVANVDQVTRAHPLQRRCRRPGSEKMNFHGIFVIEIEAFKHCS